ncbi:MAG: hypothetical protein GXX08_08420 [Firmicutes bacterium]|nr:hypothetical protein [Bacillota bacterium]
MRVKDLIKAVVDNKLDDLHTAIPARMEEIDLQRMRASVTLLRKRRVSPDSEPQPVPPILEVPVLLPKGGDFIIRPPIRKGDTVLVVFSERALDYLLVDGTPQDPKFARRHAIDDAIAIPGLMHQAESQLPAEHSKDLLIFHREKGSKIIMKEAGDVLIEVGPHRVELRIDGPSILHTSDLRLGGEGAAEGVPLGAALKQWLDGHTHSANGAGAPTQASPDPSQVVKVL